MPLRADDAPWKTWIWLAAIPLLAVGLILVNRRLPVIELTVWGWSFVVTVGIAVAIGALIYLALQSQSGKSAEQLIYMRQLRYRRWLGTIVGLALLVGLVASAYAWAVVGHLVQLVPAHEYSTIRAQVLDRSSDEGDLFNCKDSVSVQTEFGTKLRLCLERGRWWPEVPDGLRNVKEGDHVVIFLRRTVFGAGTEVARIIAPGQEVFVE
jgi:hypothetical protein